MKALKDLVEVYKKTPIKYSHLKAISLAQWMVESDLGLSELAKRHLNFGGMKYRKEMEGCATPVKINDNIYYCKFESLEKFIVGYWKFLDRNPYYGWKDHIETPISFLKFIAPIYSPAPGYFEKVLGFLDDAEELLGDTDVEEDRPDNNGLDQKLLWCPLAKIVTPGMSTENYYKDKYPLGSVIHFTAGRFTSTSVEYGRKQGYAYMAISGDGTIYQAHPLDRWGHHAGDSYWKGLGSWVSSKLVGIEVCCPGNVNKIVDKPGLGDDVYQSYFGETYTAEQVRVVDKTTASTPKGYYVKYTSAQEKSLTALLIWLKSNNPSVFNFDYVLGHCEVSGPSNGVNKSFRKPDPGGSLSMEMPQYREFLKQRYAELQQG